MITLQVKKSQNLWQSTVGLIGTKRPYPLLLKTRFGIHTYGLRFPIDIVILDKTARVVVLKKQLQPYRFFFWHPRWSTVLELPPGTIDQLQIRLGTYIVLTMI